MERDYRTTPGFEQVITYRVLDFDWDNGTCVPAGSQQCNMTIVEPNEGVLVVQVVCVCACVRVCVYDHQGQGQ